MDPHLVVGWLFFFFKHNIVLCGFAGVKVFSHIQSIAEQLGFSDILTIKEQAELVNH